MSELTELKTQFVFNKARKYQVKSIGFFSSHARDGVNCQVQLAKELQCEYCHDTLYAKTCLVKEKGDEDLDKWLASSLASPFSFYFL